MFAHLLWREYTCNVLTKLSYHSTSCIYCLPVPPSQTKCHLTRISDQKPYHQQFIIRDEGLEQCVNDPFEFFGLFYFVDGWRFVSGGDNWEMLVFLWCCGYGQCFLNYLTGVLLAYFILNILISLFLSDMSSVMLLLVLNEYNFDKLMLGFADSICQTQREAISSFGTSRNSY